MVTVKFEYFGYSVVFAITIPASAIVAHVYAWAPNTERYWLHLELPGDEALRQARQIVADTPNQYVLVTTADFTVLFEEGEIPAPLAASDFGQWRERATKSVPESKT